MKNILKIFKINNYTYLFILLACLCGYLKNVLIIFSIVLIHELGHIFFIKLFKYPIIKVELFPFGGFTTTNQHLNSDINKDLLIASGGFIFQILLFLILFLLAKYLNVITYNLYIHYNLTILLFNLIPMIPLDGSKILNLFLEKFFSYHFSYYLNFTISLISLIVFLMINYYYHLDNYFIITFLIYKLVVSYQDYKYLHQRFLLERCLYPFNYQKIDNHTKSINDLKKNHLHYFKEGNKYIKEDKKIMANFMKN